MGIALVILTDGRFDYLHETIESFREHVSYPFDQKIIVNDQGDGGSKQVGNSHSMIEKNFPDFKVISHNERRGLTEAVRSCWANFNKDIDYVFHLEGDFTFNQDIDIELLKEILYIRPHLAQIILKRQAWSAEEIEAGGYIEMDPEAYQEHVHMGCPSVHWCEHRKFFSLNPCLMPRWVTDLGWDDRNETGFTELLFSDPHRKSAVFGKKFDAPTVTHIGYNKTHHGDYNIPGGLKELQ